MPALLPYEQQSFKIFSHMALDVAIYVTTIVLHIHLNQNMFSSSLGQAIHPSDKRFTPSAVP